jgi:SAM-dependent methyltransferase
MNASLKPTQKETLEVALEKRTANVRIPRTDSEGLYPDAVGRPRGIAFQSLGMGSFTAEAIHKTILQLLKNEPRGTLLDIGAGTGALSKKLQEDGFNVLACDLNPENFIPKRDVPCKRVDLNDALPSTLSSAPRSWSTWRIHGILCENCSGSRSRTALSF